MIIVTTSPLFIHADDKLNKEGHLQDCSRLEVSLLQIRIYRMGKIVYITSVFNSRTTCVKLPNVNTVDYKRTPASWR